MKAFRTATRFFPAFERANQCGVVGWHGSLRNGVRATPKQSRIGPVTVVAILAVGGSVPLLSKALRSQKSDSETSLRQAIESTTDSGVNLIHALSLEEATAKLKRDEYEGQLGDVKFHFNRIASNNPVEDEFIYTSAPGENGKPWHFWGVFDGHAGYETSRVLRRALVPYVSNDLQNSYKYPIIATIQKAFLSLDNDISNVALAALSQPPASPTAIAALAPFVAGSCALLSIYDPSTSILRVACVGDSRAVLGRWNPETNSYTMIPLSEDQTGFNASENSRISAAHPGENNILTPKDGRMLGIAITRAFGDHRWKWTREQIVAVKEKFLGSSVRPEYKTPPYMTAEPVVTETQVRKGEKGDFVIMASDGFWDRISSEDAVECLGKWLDMRRNQGLEPEGQKNCQGDSEIEVKENQHLSYKAEPKFFVYEDENAATHLIKNCLGGSRREFFRGIMTTYPHISRDVRDDVTMHVIFFGDESLNSKT
ncbi:MAG: hypothetical protein M1820_000658 [Bogoriella megaspora]|nr:MAG: hypothetical protein M1820_000658 [Bogoriella megaspora]